MKKATIVSEINKGKKSSCLKAANGYEEFVMFLVEEDNSMVAVKLCEKSNEDFFLRKKDLYSAVSSTVDPEFYIAKPIESEGDTLSRDYFLKFDQRPVDHFAVMEKIKFISEEKI